MNSVSQTQANVKPTQVAQDPIFDTNKYIDIQEGRTELDDGLDTIMMAQRELDEFFRNVRFFLQEIPNKFLRALQRSQQ